MAILKKSSMINSSSCKNRRIRQKTLSPQLKKNIYSEIEAAGVKINEVTDEQYQRFVNIVKDHCYEESRSAIGPKYGISVSNGWKSTELVILNNIYVFVPHCV